MPAFQTRTRTFKIPLVGATQLLLIKGWLQVLRGDIVFSHAVSVERGVMGLHVLESVIDTGNISVSVKRQLFHRWECWAVSGARNGPWALSILTTANRKVSFKEVCISNVTRTDTKGMLSSYTSGNFKCVQ